MAQEVEQQLRLVNDELNQIQDQISCLLERQEKLLIQQADLQGLLDSIYDVNGEDAVDVIEQKDVVEESDEHWKGSFPWDKEANDVLLNVFGISSFRANQREIVNAVMSGKDVIVIMAAGGGKSLCYQLPAVLRNGTTLIVSPLLSLIQDQVMGLTTLGIPSAMLTSVTSKEEEKSVYTALEKGEGDLKILYVTPEKIAKSKRFMSKVEKCNQAGRLSMIAIDEAHCCSQWGHDFRPDYKNLGILKRQFPKVPMIALTVCSVPMIALTATATARVQYDLREMLQITNCVKFVSSVNRPNLFYEVREKSSNAQAVISEIASFIKQSFKKKDSGIVYCYSRKECEQVAKELRDQGISASHYHADMETNQRTAVHHRWSSNKLQVIVGTVAFGMGINKPDVRFVIHHSLGKSLETYYQESGRAGRDGLPSHCLLFFRPADVPRHSSMVFHEHAGLPNLYGMVRFCQSKHECRRAAFFKHFGEKVRECNDMCDNCAVRGTIETKDVTAHAQCIVQTVKDLEEDDKKVTLLQLADLWKTKAQKLNVNISKDLKKPEVENLIVQLLLDNYLKEVFQHTAYATNAYLALGSLWQPLLQGKRKVMLEVKQDDGSHKIHIGSGLQDLLDSEMAKALDNLRDELAQKHGEVFPHAILSTQQIAQLCAQKSASLSHVEEIIGKRKTELYGEELLLVLNKYSSGSTSGNWVSPKTETPSNNTNNKTVKRKVKETKKENRKPTKRSKQDSSTNEEPICIQDSDSDNDDS